MSNVELKDVMQAILVRYGGWLYNAALVKFLYLLDIESVRCYGSQVTKIQWVKNNYGPFVWDVVQCAKDHGEYFAICYEDGKRRIVCTNPQYSIPQEVESLIENVITVIPNPQKDFAAFKAYVYNTPPMLLARKNGPLDIGSAMQAERDVRTVLEMLDTPEWNEALAYLAAN